MQWILENWVTALVIVGLVGVHFMMHGRRGHGSHDGGQQNGGNDQTSRTDEVDEGDALIGEAIQVRSESSTR